MGFRDWSNDSQTHTQICILESQLDLKGKEISQLMTEKELLKAEIERLEILVSTLTKANPNFGSTGDVNTDYMDRFK